MKAFTFLLASLESEVVFRQSPCALPIKEITGFDPPEDLAGYTVIADEEFNIGNAWYCTDGVSGAVYRVSPEFGTAPEFVNSSMKAFKASLRAAANWSTEHDSATIRANPESVDLLANALSDIDSRAFESPEHHWAVLIEHIRHYASDDDDELEFRFEIT